MSIFTTRVLCRVDLGRYTEKPVVSVETNTAPTFGIFGILSSVFGIFRYCKYRRRYRYRYLNIGSVFWYTDPIRSLSSPAKDRRSANCSTQPTGTVQADLDRLIEWADKWLMQFNVNKCKVMHVGQKNPRLSYTMRSNELQTVEVEKDLGEMISSDRKCSQQCRYAY